jgi:hypothetical protein
MVSTTELHFQARLTTRSGPPVCHGKSVEMPLLLPPTGGALHISPLYPFAKRMLSKPAARYFLQDAFTVTVVSGLLMPTSSTFGKTSSGKMDEWTIGRDPRCNAR